jgi:hypothetical protein
MFQLVRIVEVAAIAAGQANSTRQKLPPLGHPATIH